jgi:hypothetical protein
MHNAHLHRTSYPTDVSDQDPEYWGAFSVPFPDPRHRTDGAQIVGVDWSVRGEVTVTYLIPE